VLCTESREASLVFFDKLKLIVDASIVKTGLINWLFKKKLTTTGIPTLDKLEKPTLLVNAKGRVFLFWFSPAQNQNVF